MSESKALMARHSTRTWACQLVSVELGGGERWRWPLAFASDLFTLVGNYLINSSGNRRHLNGTSTRLSSPYSRSVPAWSSSPPPPPSRSRPIFRSRPSWERSWPWPTAIPSPCFWGPAAQDPTRRIDCPESRQDFGTRAKEAIAGKVFGKEVTINWKARDKYRRILGDVYLGERHINLEMVQEGWAWHYVQYSKDALLAKAEKEAREAKRGLWAGPNPIPPWEYRKGKVDPKEAVRMLKWQSSRSTLRRAARSTTGRDAGLWPEQEHPHASGPGPRASMGLARSAIRQR